MNFLKLKIFEIFENDYSGLLALLPMMDGKTVYYIFFLNVNENEN
jgi:hypothetical protein